MRMTGLVITAVIGLTHTGTRRYRRRPVNNAQEKCVGRSSVVRLWSGAASRTGPSNAINGKSGATSLGVNTRYSIP